MGAAIIDFRMCPPLVKVSKYYVLRVYRYAEKQQKNKKGKKVHAVFYQVGFILILYGEYNSNLKKNTYQVIYLLSLYLSFIKLKHLNI
jgi:hypothetical protein